MTGTAKNCVLCSHCGMEPDCEPYCANPQVLQMLVDDPKAGYSPMVKIFGANVINARKACQGQHFEQHPRRIPKT